MPELPEVETYARYFARHALHQRIARVDVRDPRILGEVHVGRPSGRPPAGGLKPALHLRSFVRTLKGCAFDEVRRHGKHLFARATRDSKPATWLRLHFGMTGDLAYYRQGGPPRFARVVFDFAGGAHLAFEDMRLFGEAGLVDDPDAFIAEHRLGPDPLRLRPNQFAALLATRRGAIKSLLMTQDVVAGLGNLYVDEILYQTGIHPRRAADRLSDADVRAVFTAMRRILRDAIARHARGAELPPRSLIHHRAEGERCPRCGGTIARSVVFGRTTYFCAKHQR